jgi:prepilin-type N-terminal cleavage/methylation domain-containing protein
MSRQRRGFSLIEIVTVVVIVGLVSLLGRQTYVAIQKSADELATRTTIGAVLVDARRVVAETAAATNTPEFPADLVSRLVASDVTATSGPSTAPEEVSVTRLDAVTAVYASFGGGKCTVMVDRLVGASGWGSEDAAITCIATSYAHRLGELTGTSDVPATL